MKHELRAEFLPPICWLVLPHRSRAHRAAERPSYYFAIILIIIWFTVPLLAKQWSDSLCHVTVITVPVCAAWCLEFAYHSDSAVYLRPDSESCCWFGAAVWSRKLCVCVCLQPGTIAMISPASMEISKIWSVLFPLCSIREVWITAIVLEQDNRPIFGCLSSDSPNPWMAWPIRCCDLLWCD